jgi:diacylglycerol kinase (ATP)
VDSIVVSAIPPWAKRTFGRIAYISRGLREAVTFPAVPARIRVDGEVMEVNLLMVVVGNTRSYGGVLKITNLAIADDGQLDMVVYNGSGVGRIVNYLARTFIGRHVRAPGATYRSARVIEVETRTPLPVQVDGDLAGQSPARFEIVPGALWVIVPPLPYAPLFTRPAIPLAADAAPAPTSPSRAARAR